MGKAVFVGLSAAIFIAYSLVARALLVPDQQTPFQSTVEQQEDCEAYYISGECDRRWISEFLVSIPVLGNILNGAGDAASAAYNLFAPFFQLITFQAKGLTGASFVTALIFTPLIIMNTFIIASVVRGSG